MRCIGVDPGVTGALALLRIDGTFSEAYALEMPVMSGRIDVAEALRMLGTMAQYSLEHGPEPTHVYIEKAQAMPGQGVSGMFRYGVNYGILLGLCAALRVPYTEIPPGVWKRKMGLGKDKNLSRQRAQQLFPQCSFTRKKDDGRAEALLLAWYGSQYYQKES